MICESKKIIRMPKLLCHLTQETFMPTSKRYLNNAHAENRRMEINLEVVAKTDDDVKEFYTFWRNTGNGTHPFAVDLYIMGTVRTVIGVITEGITELKDESGVNRFAIAAKILRLDALWDVIPPTIVLLGNNPDNISGGGEYVDSGATAYDNIDGDITPQIVTSSNLDMSKVGNYEMVYTVFDSSGNKATATRTINVVDIDDNAPPTISLLGGNPVTIEQGSPYVEAGATAYDLIDGDVTANIAITGSVDTGAVGVYSVKYNVSDAAGNAALEKTRTINVIVAPDVTPPVIYLTGNPNVTIVEGSTYYDLGATASDDVDGDITHNINVTNNVNTGTIGTYQVLYNVSDAAGNHAATVTRTVIVEALPSGSVEFGTAGTRTWTVPANVHKISICAIAAGGSGGAIFDTTATAKAGGGRAGVIRSSTNYPVTPGDVYTITIGIGGQGIMHKPNLGAQDGKRGGSTLLVNPSGWAVINATGGFGGIVDHTAVYRGEGGLQMRCIGNFRDGNLIIGSMAGTAQAYYAYGGEAGLADATQGSPTTYPKGAQANRGAGGNSVLVGNETSGSEGGGDGFMRIVWGNEALNNAHSQYI